MNFLNNICNINPVNQVIVSRSHPGKVLKLVKASSRGLDDGDEMSIERAGGSGYKSVQVLKSAVGAYVHSGKIKKRLSPLPALPFA